MVLWSVALSCVGTIVNGARVSSTMGVGAMVIGAVVIGAMVSGAAAE